MHEALLEVFDTFHEKPARMWVAAENLKQSAYNEQRLARAFASGQTRRVSVKGAGDPLIEISLDLRDEPGSLRDSSARRFVEVMTPLVAPGDPRLLRFLQVACAAYDVVQGGVCAAPNYQQANAEMNLTLSSELAPETYRRIQFDAMHQHEAQTKLRRLYPVTIIGPAIWATLPPLPATDPPLVVRDLADCKMITAWPTLTDPHDLDFLLGTRDLRRWLWPYTIGNPADDPANTDNRLKWAERIPW